MSIKPCNINTYKITIVTLGTVPGAGVGLSPVSERDSTASILDVSDLSFDHTRDTLGNTLGGGADESRLR